MLKNGDILDFLCVEFPEIREDFSQCGDRLGNKRADIYQIFADALTSEATSYT